MTLALGAHADAGGCTGGDCILWVYGEALRLPSSGSQDVPTTVQPIVADAVDAGFLDVATDTWIGGELERLVGHPSLSRLKPDALLPPSSTIELWTVDGAGDRQERLGSFETGTGPDADAPAAPSGLFIDSFNRGNNPCTEAGVVLSAGWEEVVDAGGGVTYEARFAHPQREAMLGVEDPLAEAATFGSCGVIIPEMTTGDVVEVDVRTIDLSGNVSEWSSTAQATVPEKGCGCTSAPGPAGVGLTGLAALALLFVRRRIQGDSQ